ncbi:hypothetical protein A2V71_04420 [Candidatus Berkelbacteria bacterium RBG_13_40_8]|uniref:Endonuclease GajA/Old nuclease/RecF-like AAA domain-containing protein n=1 Tax=Candidatus Berkelbacteria bacterium RBG_13_40_8 TaxID=1797467 RepID=A0A1F5DMA5_9BACT|nr:MAG: hypothetical protein A2V71_04420 [Candidatus Berkelbacteria bacterium RBG_13_40_8]
MKYKRFHIEKYKALVNSDLTVISKPVPIIGVNESGKSSALEAIAHFDLRNDNFITGKGWKFLNRYKPEDNEFCVSADIEITQSELEEIINKHIPVDEPPAEQPAAETPPEQPAENPETQPQPEAPKENFDDLRSIITSANTIKIARHFNSRDDTKTYSINGITRDEVQSVIKDIIEKLPRLYYFDNFLENPLPDTIPFSDNYISGQTDILENEQQAMIEGAFSSIEISLRDFINTKDEDTRATWVDRVNDNVTKRVIADWQKMNFQAGKLDISNFSDIEIEFKLSEDKKAIQIKIKEQFKNKDGKTYPPITMGLSERSLGFRWFFNFSMRKCFAAVHEQEFIYLFDEPGSYLHNSAQTVLLDAIINLAEQHPVIYSTHCEFLLDPDKININDIRVVQKEEHSIKLIPLSNASTKKHEGALSTLNNALKMRIPLETVMNKKVIVTEGITDFYFWKHLIDVVFLPGSGAGNNRYLISIAIGSSKKYIALFDGDEAGNNAIDQYKKHFGEPESQNWKSYLNSDEKTVRLEDLLSDADKLRLQQISGQEDIKQAITGLFFAKKHKEFWEGIDSATKANVQKSISMIATHLSITNTGLRHGFTV